ncbi:HTH-type transcriptional regulator KipR [Aquamicrobium terrae]
MTGKGESLGTVQRVVEVLRHLAERGDTTIKDLSAAIGLVPSTSHRMLDLLVKEGLVERVGERRSYQIGPEFFRLAALVNTRQDIRSLARPYLQQVVDACDETCVLCLYVRSERHMFFAEKIDSSQLLRYQLQLNSPVPVLWGASGRSILAYLPREERRQIFEEAGDAPASGEKRPPIDTLETELAAIRARGYAVSHGQKIAGAVGINSPVFNAAGEVVGSLGITVPQQRLDPSDEPKLGLLVRYHAAALSRVLGASMPKADEKEVVLA